ncbi:MAG TPA: carboxylesterase family protein [Edaphobacter sp.]|nr:carboxylesterase family protein [Edaphobacter sp.]
MPSNLLRRALPATFLILSSVAFGAVPQQVKTDKGVVEGEPTVDGKVMSFKGIPYAAPPVGKLRWAPPAPAESWQGVRSAHDFGYHCVQSAAYNDMAFHDPGPSEDCLTLNVWAPADAQPGKLPVMVWIYGGGYSGGSTSEHRQDGQFLAHRNVVVVSMNYRLGVFGFFVHPELAAESPHHAAGNYGLMDQTAAIRWVKENVAAFGGDPSNITIFGESAGSFSVSSQMASPLSRDLFQKAIGESGGALGGSSRKPEPTLEEREKTDAAFALTSYGTAKLAELRRLPTEDIIRPVLATRPGPRFGPVVDGYFFPKPVAEIYAAGEQAHIPLLAGWNADEGRGGIVGSINKFSAEGFAAQAEQEFPGRGAEMLKLYPAGTEKEALSSAADYGGDKFIAYSTWRWLESQVATGGKPVYRYLFALGNPGDRYHTPAVGAFHSDDIEYVFGTLDLRPEAVLRPEDRKLSNEIQGYWTNFAKTGDPNGPGLPKWPIYGPTEWETMHLDKTSAAKPDANRERYLFLDSVWSKPKPAS